MRGVKTKESGKPKKIMVFLILLIIFGFLANSVRKVYQKKESAEKALARMESQMAELQNRQKYLAESINRLATAEGLKFEIRKKLNVAEVGESVAIIVDEETSSTTKVSDVSTWQKFKNFFNGLFD